MTQLIQIMHSVSAVSHVMSLDCSQSCDKSFSYSTFNHELTSALAVFGKTSVDTMNARTYEGSRWPTYSSELLAIPESERWCNAESSFGTTCAITGPVKRVYENQDTAGNTVTIIEMGTGSSFRGSRPVSPLI